MIYVALLRGINVGGNCKVEMVRLKALFERLGFSNVKTYINSGNIIFTDSKHTPEELVTLIDAALLKEFGLQIPVIVRNSKNIQSLVRTVQDDWTNDKMQKTDVLFLWDGINNADIMQKVVINPDLENVIYTHGALIWNIGRSNVTQGNGIKLIKTNLYKHMTARNINTVRKLNELMQQMSK